MRVIGEIILASNYSIQMLYGTSYLKILQKERGRFNHTSIKLLYSKPLWYILFNDFTEGEWKV